MRYLRQPNGPKAGEPFRFTNEQLRFVLWWYAVDDTGAWLFRKGVRRLSKGSGKAGALIQKIPTPSGWTTVGALRVGDEIFGADGSVQRVAQLHPITYEDMFDVELSDGSVERFSGEHLFTVDVFTGSGRTRKTLSVREMLAAGLKYPRKLTTGRTKAVNPDVARYTIPDNPVLDLPEADLPIDPYVLGMWLGDGDSDAARITVGAQDLAETAQALSDRIEVGEPKRTNTAYRLQLGGRGVVISALRELGVLGDKHIPDCYLRASANQRLELLRGLMDSDGTVSSTGRAEFCVTSEPLARGAAELIRTLGYRVNVRANNATLCGRVVGTRYRLMFTPRPDRNPFRLERKASRVVAATRRQPGRAIVDIREAEATPARCITTTAPDGLYLAGETFWVTHNSPFAAVLAIIEFLGPCRFAGFDESQWGGVRAKSVHMPLVQICATSEAQTENTMRMVRAMLPKGSKVAEEYGIDPGKTRYFLPPEGTLTVVTSSAATLEGAEATFAIADETEHWLPGNGGPELMATLEDNLSKSGSRLVETANAWREGRDSVAEATHRAWLAEREGKTRGERGILYDARMFPGDLDMSDRDELRKALEVVYAGCWWVDVEAIIERIYAPEADPDDSLRKYGNIPTATSGAWVPWRAWQPLGTTDRLEEGDEIAIGFDGSLTGDATALVACRISDGLVQPLRIWEPRESGEPVPVEEVDEIVSRVMEESGLVPVAMFCDVAYWESYVKVTWAKRWGKQMVTWAKPSGKDPQPFAYDLRGNQYEWTREVELVRREILQGDLRHTEDPVLSRHVLNAMIHPTRWGDGIRKRTKDSPDKIDATVGMILARMARRRYLADTAKKRQRTGKVW